MDALTLLTTRYSSARLTEPAPAGDALAKIKAAALRVPDHGALKPWHFIVFSGKKALSKLGDIFAEAALEDNPTIAEDLLERARQLPLRAPMVIACVAKCREHHKVPVQEQIQSAACAVMAMQQAAFAQGFGGIWRTGAYTQFEFVKQTLGLAEDDEIVGYLYLGTCATDVVHKPDLDPNDFFVNFA